jgi:glycosyltransferase involved in cell wall biosynthesis
MLGSSQNLDKPVQLVAPLPPCKVSIIVGDLSAKGAGRWGGAVRPFLLAQALKRLGCQVEILGFTDDLAAPPLPIDLVVKRFSQGIYPQFLGAASQLIRQIEGDIIYAYKTKASSFGVGLLARQWRRRPLVLDIDDWEMSWHGGDQWRYCSQGKQRYRDLIKSDGALRQPDHPVYLQRMERLTHRADGITLHTQFLKRRFGGVCIPNGKDTDTFDPNAYSYQASRQRYGLRDYRVLMFPGAPRPYKGLEDILAALELRDRPDEKLVIVGGSPYDDYDQTLRQRWSHRIIQLPRVPHYEMPSVIAAADIVVVPQQDTAAAQAQFPLKLTDGMAMAKPILTTRVGDIPEILADTGYLVAPGDVQAMAIQIEQILAHPNVAAEKGRQARQRCVEHYSLDAMATGLSTVISPLLTTKLQRAGRKLSHSGSR